jgi:hypothetical protein
MASGEDKDTEGCEECGDGDEWSLPKFVAMLGLTIAFTVAMLSGISGSKLGVFIGVGIALLTLVIAGVIACFIALVLFNNAIAESIIKRYGYRKDDQTDKQTGSTID